MAKATGKVWWQSREIWVNGVAVILAVGVSLGVFGEGDVALVAQDVASTAVIFAPFVTILLRLFFTKEPIKGLNLGGK